jgi:hypothetical protein
MKCTDAAAAGDHYGFVVERIVHVRQSGVNAGRGLIDLGWKERAAVKKNYQRNDAQLSRYQCLDWHY